MNGRLLISVGLMLPVAGMILGGWIGAMDELEYLSIHTTLMLPGFVVLTIYGGIYRLWPEFESLALARTQTLLAVGSALLMIGGSVIQVTAGPVALIAVGSLGAIVAATLLLGMVMLRGNVRVRPEIRRGRKAHVRFRTEVNLRTPPNRRPWRPGRSGRLPTTGCPAHELATRRVLPSGLQPIPQRPLLEWLRVAWAASPPFPVSWVPRRRSGQRPQPLTTTVLVVRR